LTGRSVCNLALFQEWFEVCFFDLVADQGQEPLASYETDGSFQNCLRSVINAVDNPGMAGN
jgi:hypothetical protein